MEGSLLPYAGFDKSRHVRGPCRHRPVQQPEEKGRSRVGDGVAYWRLCHLSPLSTLGWRPPQVISWIAEPLTGTPWRNSSVYLFWYIRWLKKRKVVTIRKMHNLLLSRHISECDNINCVLYQLGSWSQGALVRERANPSLIIGKLLSWEPGLEDTVYQTSAVFTTVFYIACVCEGRVIIISDQLQMPRKLFNSDVMLPICITGNTVYFQAVHKGVFLC